MIKGNEPAYPANPTNVRDHKVGLTKREHFAGLAMQGLMANIRNKDGDILCVEWFARRAKEQADALLLELSKEVSDD